MSPSLVDQVFFLRTENLQIPVAYLCVQLLLARDDYGLQNKKKGDFDAHSSPINSNGV